MRTMQLGKESIRVHICQRGIFTTRWAPTPPAVSYTPEVSAPDASYNTSQGGSLFESSPPPPPSPSRPPEVFESVFLQFEILGKTAGAIGVGFFFFWPLEGIFFFSP